MAVSIRRSTPSQPVGTSRGERNRFHEGRPSSGHMKHRRRVCRGEIKLLLFGGFLACRFTEDAE